MNKGLQRIAIIASVIWVVVGTFWLHSLLMDERGHLAHQRFGHCIDEARRLPDNRSGAMDTCSAAFEEEWVRDVGPDAPIWGAALINVGIALILGWLALWIVTSLTAWVYRGFRGA